MNTLTLFTGTHLWCHMLNILSQQKTVWYTEQDIRPFNWPCCIWWSGIPWLRIHLPLL